MADIIGGKTASGTQNAQNPAIETPGDTGAPDIVGPTGEEMPDIAHDDGDGEYEDDNLDPQTQEGVVRKAGR